MRGKREKIHAYLFAFRLMPTPAWQRQHSTRFPAFRLLFLSLALTWSMCLSSKPLLKAALWVFLLLEEPTPRLPTPNAFPILKSEGKGKSRERSEVCLFFFSTSSLSFFFSPSLSVFNSPSSTQSKQTKKKHSIGQHRHTGEEEIMNGD